MAPQGVEVMRLPCNFICIVAGLLRHAASKDSNDVVGLFHPFRIRKDIFYGYALHSEESIFIHAFSSFPRFALATDWRTDRYATGVLHVYRFPLLHPCPVHKCNGHYGWWKDGVRSQ